MTAGQESDDECGQSDSARYDEASSILCLNPTPGEPKPAVCQCTWKTANGNNRVSGRFQNCSHLDKGDAVIFKLKHGKDTLSASEMLDTFTGDVKGVEKLLESGTGYERQAKAFEVQDVLVDMADKVTKNEATEEEEGEGGAKKENKSETVKLMSYLLNVLDTLGPKMAGALQAGDTRKETHGNVVMKIQNFDLRADPNVALDSGKNSVTLKLDRSSGTDQVGVCLTALSGSSVQSIARQAK
jgi:hypothetical protein